MLALYGHPFSSYTWKAQIALHALRLDHDFRVIDADHPEHGHFVATQAGPLGQFPVLVDGDHVIFEASCIVEYLSLHHGEGLQLIPDDPDAALAVRMLDRVFDLGVMNAVQAAVAEALRHPGAPDAEVLAELRGKLRQSYGWLERWLACSWPDPGHVTMIECAAAPALFYADWVEEISSQFPHLRRWRAQLNALPEVSACIEAARPFRPYFPLGAPDRD